MNQTDEVRAALAGATSIAVLTGAGVSAESGIPTFREAQSGIWARFDPQELASEAGFLRDPERVWSWYAERRARIASAHPNGAHIALAQLEHQRGARIITQNVDGLHRRAGSANVIELHGNIERACCFARCGWHGPADLLEATDARRPPHCPECGQRARPDVVWFGEMLPPEAWSAAESLCGKAALCIVVGTSAQVYPAAGLAEICARAGGRLVVVNPEESPIDGLAWRVLRARAAEILPALMKH